MIEIIDLNKSFGRKRILDNINLSIEKGAAYALLGKNGAGKTTLIHLILNLLKPDSGKILIIGKENNKLNASDKKKIGVLGEDLALIEELNGYDFLFFIGKIYNIPKNILQQRVKDLFNYFFDNEEDLKKNISYYSTGMKKKIAFCASVLHTPDILILDEPFAGLDPLVANKMVDFLKCYQKDYRTIFISSHDLNYAEKFATHIGVLNDSTFQFNSTLQEFTNNGINSLDSALIRILKPNDEEKINIDWL